MHDGFKYPEEMNQRLAGFLVEDETPWIQRYEIRAPNRSQPHQRNGYRYVAIMWHDGVYASYQIPTEIQLEDLAGSWSVSIGQVTVILNDYSPWDD
jgi:hypothetical protein